MFEAGLRAMLRVHPRCRLAMRSSQGHALAFIRPSCQAPLQGQVQMPLQREVLQLKACSSCFICGAYSQACAVTTCLLHRLLHAGCTMHADHWLKTV